MIPSTLAKWLEGVALHLNHPLQASKGKSIFVIGPDEHNKELIGRLAQEVQQRIAFTGWCGELLHRLPGGETLSHGVIVSTHPHCSETNYLAELLKHHWPQCELYHRANFEVDNGAQPLDDATSGDITFVVQGPWIKGGTTTYGTDSTIDSIRRYYPKSRIVLSTWKGNTPSHSDIDDVIFSDDPGPLPPLKSIDLKPNNINRQILSTKRGLLSVRTPFAIKIRTDCGLNSAAAWITFDKYSREFGKPADFNERVMVLRYFTMSMKGIERLPYHVSDIFQVGRTEDLLRIWDKPMMSWNDATYFQHAKHNKRVSTFSPFLSRFAVEQYLHLPADVLSGVTSGDDLMTAKHMKNYDDYLADNFIVAEPESCGLVAQRFENSFNWRKQRWNCVSESDWYRMAIGEPLPSIDPRRMLSTINARRIGRF